MPADLTGLRKHLEAAARRVVVDAADEAARVAEADRRVTSQSTGPAAARLGSRPADKVAVKAVSGGGSRVRATVRADTWGWQWRTGGPMRPFDPHQRLVGVKVTKPDDPRLRNPAAWPGVSHFYPQDHRGCLCYTVPARVPGERGLWRSVLTDALHRGLAIAGRRFGR